MELKKTSAHILGKSKVGDGTLLAWNVIIGHPAKEILLAERDFSVSKGSVIGESCILRSGTVVYENVVIGNNVQTAHHVVIREGVRIGDDCVFGNNTEVQIGAQLGRNVRIHTCAIISEGAQIGNDVFIGPGVVFTGGRFMTGALEASGRLKHEDATAMEGRYWEGPSVIVEDDVRIGANSVILTGVRLGKGCVVAAGAVVSNDVPPGALVVGNPARLLKHNIKSDREGF